MNKKCLKCDAWNVTSRNRHIGVHHFFCYYQHMMKFACWFAIGIGFAIFTLATSGRVAANGAALGVFMIFIGLNGFTSIRIAKLEETVKEMKKGSERVPSVKDMQSGS